MRYAYLARLSVALAGSGCFDEEDFVDRFSKLDCRRLLECSDATAVLGEPEACLSQVHSSVSTNRRCMEQHCTFSEAGAKDCLKALKTLPCDAIVRGGLADACDRVWTLCDGEEVACYSDDTGS